MPEKISELIIDALDRELKRLHEKMHEEPYIPTCILNRIIQIEDQLMRMADCINCKKEV